MEKILDPTGSPAAAYIIVLFFLSIVGRGHAVL
jgi:hypothetical protein